MLKILNKLMIVVFLFIMNKTYSQNNYDTIVVSSQYYTLKGLVNGDGRRIGVWVKTDVNGVITGKISYDANDNFIVRNYNDKHLKYRYEGFRKDTLDIIDGLYLRLDNDGNIMTKSTYKEGLESGTRYNYNNNILTSKKEFKKDVLDGFYLEYHPNTKLKTKGHYKNGNKVGRWLEYNNEGELLFNGKYSNGKTIVVLDAEIEKFYFLSEKNDTLKVLDGKEIKPYEKEYGSYYPMFIYHKKGKWVFFENGITTIKYFKKGEEVTH